MTGSPFTSAHQRSTSAINLTIALARSPYGTRTYVSTSAIQRDPGRLRARDGLDTYVRRVRTCAPNISAMGTSALDRAGALVGSDTKDRGDQPMDTCPSFRPSELLPLLFAKADLAAVRAQLGVSDDIAVVRHQIVETARSPDFINGILQQTPDSLAPACMELLDSWYTSGAPKRHQLARLRRVITTIASLRTVYCGALSA